MSVVPETPTGTSRWSDSARTLSQHVRTALQAALPEHVIITQEERSRLQTAANVPDEFLEQIARALEESAAFSSETKLRPNEIRDTIAMAQAFNALANDLETSVVRTIRDTVTVRRAEVGEEALRLYGVWRKVDRPRDRQSSVPHLIRLKEALGRGRGRSRRIKREPAILPQTEPAVTPAAPATGGAA